MIIGENVRRSVKALRKTTSQFLFTIEVTRATNILTLINKLIVSCILSQIVPCLFFIIKSLSFLSLCLQLAYLQNLFLRYLFYPGYPPPLLTPQKLYAHNLTGALELE